MLIVLVIFSDVTTGYVFESICFISVLDFSLGLLNDELIGAGRDDGALRIWAFRRFTDSESYWLFRRGVALHAGVLGLVECLFNLTPVQATSLLVEPRVARLEIGNLLFDLPSAPPPHATGTSLKDTGFLMKASTALAKVFASSFAPLNCSPSPANVPTSSPSVTMNQGQRHLGS